ncbi:hypothetical protein [Litoribacter populi]|uniref:hypothetical protein n=1 Tax=Litoribacter populi TaxID=2598460 RepID=UPI00117E41C8|nr:hypothetical protein [Litoribacter populi]
MKKKFVKIINRIDLAYKWHFWKLKQDGNEYTLESRAWLHNVKDIILLPVYMIMAFCAGLMALFDAPAYKRKLTVRLPEEMTDQAEKDFKKTIKTHLLR